MLNTLSPLRECPFLPDVPAEGERYFRGPQNAIPSSSCPVFGPLAAGSKATVASPGNAAIAADGRANFGRDRPRF